ncbi:MGMT family protein [Lactococcus protaetiae]|uniref:MGMT family protein n=1 Tax=Lactococcus protaetiae TaxID=2592653 RepID=A0A514ZB01_9LACT|nr:MGMT family protein [Lactococcus protaetiae]MCL2112820.1 MGMT family protein [Streptococcaceae bacterium]QDK71762.1 MGMT family protein [Lactococcus protaetiae]
MAELTETTKKILSVLTEIPEGTVMSYRDVGRLAGLSNGARQVSRVLHSMSKKYQLPWWRVISSKGVISLPEPGRTEQIARLRAEGLEVSAQGKVIL